MLTVCAYAAMLLLEPELGTGHGAGHALVTVLALHQQPDCIIDHCRHSDCCNQPGAQTLMLQTCTLLHTACTVSAGRLHCPHPSS